MSYNGWKNRATWLVSVWFNPQSKADVQMARDCIEEAEDDMPTYMLDFLCTNEIDWQELMDQFEETEDAEED